MLQEPEQGLPGAAELGRLVEDKGGGLLDAEVGVLLEPWEQVSGNAWSLLLNLR